MVGVYTVILTVPADATPGSTDPVQVIAYDASNTPYFAQGSVIPVQ
jgi:hypothetical protein